MRNAESRAAGVSPVLANVYLHYVLDLRFERRFKKSCRRWTELTRYADDFVAAFQDREDAERFRREVEERLAAFELHVAPEKTAVLRFDGNLLHGTGRPAIKPATFTFLGFKHFLTKTRRGTINIGRTASTKARERFLKRQADWLRTNRHLDVRQQQAHLRLALNGYYQYFGVRLAEQPCTPCIDGYASCGGSSCDGEVSEPDEPVLGRICTPNLGSSFLDHGSHRRGSRNLHAWQRMCSGDPGALIAHARFYPGVGRRLLIPTGPNISPACRICCTSRSIKRVVALLSFSPRPPGPDVPLNDT